MYHSSDVIRQMQARKIISQKLDNAFTGVWNQVQNQIGMIGDGSKRLFYYTSCFTQDYQDVCVNQKMEDIRFRKGVYHLIKNRNSISEMVRLYIELLLKNRTPMQLDHIKRLLMKANIHIAASTLTTQTFALGVTMTVCLGLDVRLPVSRGIGGFAGAAAGGLGIYGIIQGAADSARRLQILCPKYYSLLYMYELEMMYFLLEPFFMRSGALELQDLADNNVADAIINLVRQR
ncbi:hypothetical protein [Chimaeribacter arupi]|uniref:Uncharacterized protein n=1 Tax=Chimaeribacter arupi TaxID=2060066 RepID=A0A2N5EJ00_9GAMM|nr:hypothetical protein [Chimaeribacter arupi]PLR45213.1 hypothetical protein CYR34_18095 [Chimaeribacter arupi]